jgi:hypothetical protein
MNRFVLKNNFIKNISIPLFDKYFYKNKKSKLDFWHRVIIQNDLFYGTSTLTVQNTKLSEMLSWPLVRVVCRFDWIGPAASKGGANQASA